MNRVNQLTELINRYKDGLDHIGEHRDDEKELAPLSPIASVSFGACRDFVFRRRGRAGPGRAGPGSPQRISLPLAHGSLLLMKHPTNLHWYHSLPPRRRVLAPRVNLTFRNVLPRVKQGNVQPQGLWALKSEVLVHAGSVDSTSSSR